MSNEILDALKGDNDIEENVAPEPKQADSKAEIDELKQTIIGNQNLINQVMGKMDTIASLVQTRPEPKEEVLYGDDGEELTPEQVLEITRKERRAESDKEKLLRKQAEWDSRTDKDFGPYGFTDKSSKFYREVHAEYSSNGDKKSPTGVYDAASRVFARGTREGWISTAKPDINMTTLEGGLPRRSPKQSKKVTEAQEHFGAKLGFSKERIKKIYNKGGEA